MKSVMMCLCLVASMLFMQSNAQGSRSKATIKKKSFIPF